MPFVGTELLLPFVGTRLLLHNHGIDVVLSVQVLSPAFGGMTAFVKETEPLLERGQGQVIRPDERMWNLRSLVTSCRPSILKMPLQFHSYKISTSTKRWKLWTCM